MSRPSAAAEGAVGPKPLQKGHGPREQPRLPTLEVLHELDAADRTCPACGGELKA